MDAQLKLLTLRLIAVLMPVLVRAETVSLPNGTNLFMSGTSVLPAVDTTGDVFAAGESVKLGGR